MGQAFPTGMRLTRREGADPTPWLWGVNGASGVVASVVAVIVSISAGITTTLALSAVCYVLLILPGLSMIRAQER
jgi:hypothetical protein